MNWVLRNGPESEAWLQGYAIYVDGLLTAVQQAPQPVFAVSGGKPIAVDGNLVLCGRADLGADRFFDGRIAQLSVFDSALTQQAVRFVTRSMQTRLLLPH